MRTRELSEAVERLERLVNHAERFLGGYTKGHDAMIAEAHEIADAARRLAASIPRDDPDQGVIFRIIALCGRAEAIIRSRANVQ